MTNPKHLALVATFWALLVTAVHGQFSNTDGVPLPLAPGARLPEQQLWHNNQQIVWRPERLFHPEQSLSFQYIKEGGVDLHFLDKTHLEGFDAQVKALAWLAACMAACLGCLPWGGGARHEGGQSAPTGLVPFSFHGPH